MTAIREHLDGMNGTEADNPQSEASSPAQKARQRDLLPFDISPGDAKHFPFSDEPLAVSEIAELINELIDREKMKCLKVHSITAFLEINGVIETVNTDGKSTKRPTWLGREIGIVEIERTGKSGKYMLLQYPRAVQEYIIGNIEEIIRIDRMSLEEREEAKNA